MKTLDEVITGMTELILSGKTADVKSTVRGALHYLKAYRENQQAYEENTRKAEEARERYLEAMKELRNDPLTDKGE